MVQPGKWGIWVQTVESSRLSDWKEIGKIPSVTSLSLLCEMGIILLPVG